MRAVFGEWREERPGTRRRRLYGLEEGRDWRKVWVSWRSRVSAVRNCPDLIEGHSQYFILVLEVLLGVDRAWFMRLSVVL